MDGPYMPMKTKRENEEMEPKQRNNWTDAEVKKVQINFKAINTLHCALNPIKFNRISTCKSTKEIWDKMKVTHERTTQLEEFKIAFISNQY